MHILKISPGWVVVMCALYYVDPMGYFGPFIAAMVFHEVGHCLALWICRVPIQSIQLNLTGAALETETMEYHKEIFCALAGPAASLLLTGTAPWYPNLAVISLCLAIFNLLPVPPLDGGRALRAILLLHWDTVTVTKILTILCVLCAVMLMMLSIWASVYLQGGFWPVLVAALLLCRVGLCVAEDQKNA